MNKRRIGFTETKQPKKIFNKRECEQISIESFDFGRFMSYNPRVFILYGLSGSSQRHKIKSKLMSFIETKNEFEVLDLENNKMLEISNSIITIGDRVAKTWQKNNLYKMLESARERKNYIFLFMNYGGIDYQVRDFIDAIFVHNTAFETHENVLHWHTRAFSKSKEFHYLDTFQRYITEMKKYSFGYAVLGHENRFLGSVTHDPTDQDNQSKNRADYYHNQRDYQETSEKKVGNYSFFR
jgi:hypothetical protein